MKTDYIETMLKELELPQLTELFGHAMELSKYLVATVEELGGTESQQFRSSLFLIIHLTNFFIESSSHPEEVRKMVGNAVLMKPGFPTEVETPEVVH